eukprot:360642-Chlamydomonas_euryale.AAC.6
MPHAPPHAPPKLLLFEAALVTTAGLHNKIVRCVAGAAAATWPRRRVAAAARAHAASRRSGHAHVADVNDAGMCGAGYPPRCLAGVGLSWVSRAHRALARRRWAAQDAESPHETHIFATCRALRSQKAGGRKGERAAAGGVDTQGGGPVRTPAS